MTFHVAFFIDPCQISAKHKVNKRKEFLKSKCQNQSISFKVACESVERLHFCINILEWQDCMSGWLKKGHKSMICLLYLFFLLLFSNKIRSEKDNSYAADITTSAKECNCPLGSFLSPIDSACRPPFSWPFLVWEDVFGEQM